MHSRRIVIRSPIVSPHVDTLNATSLRICCIQEDTTVESILDSMVPSKVRTTRGSFRLVGSRSHMHLCPTVPLLEQLEERGIQETVFDILPRLRGGGGDGGSTGAEDRSAYLAMYAGKKPDKIDPAEQRLAQYTTCRLSGEPLRPPCVCDNLGSLYNKDAVLMALLSKTVPKSLAHLTSRKSVHDVVLHPVDGSEHGVRYGCPVTGLPLSGKYRFVVVKSTSDDPWHVVSDKAVKELPVVVQGKIGSSVPEKGNLLPIYPQGEELNDLLDIVMRNHREELVEKAAKKAKKEKRKRLREVTTADCEAKGVGTTKAETTKRLSHEETIPAGATPAVWQSLFVDKKKLKENPEGDSGYMTRGVRKYI